MTVLSCGRLVAGARSRAIHEFEVLIGTTDGPGRAVGTAFVDDHDEACAQETRVLASPISELMQPVAVGGSVRVSGSQQRGFDLVVPPRLIALQ